jgi:conjugative relaxase-like TrwC/TraI family protein
MKEGAQYFRELNGRNASDKEELGRFVTAQTKPASQTVAGYDLVFAPAKSAQCCGPSAAMRPAKQIEAAHHEAIEETMQSSNAKQHSPAADATASARKTLTADSIYTTFRHYDSRNGDPQLHDHVVVSNKVKGADGKWSSLDGRLLYQFNVAASEHYNRTVLEKVCARLGVGVIERKVSGDRPVIEIAGVDVAAIEAASSRSGDQAGPGRTRAELHRGQRLRPQHEGHDRPRAAGNPGHPAREKAARQLVTWWGVDRRFLPSPAWWSVLPL